MPTLYIHTGLHKTGTTSLQKAFFDNRAALARQNVLYPDAGLSQKPFNWGHHELAYAMRRRAGAQALWQSLRDEADASGLDKILVSSEELSLLPFPHFPGAEPYKLIAKIFEGYEIRHITYLRPQAELICSLYNHNVKAVGERRDILEFIADVERDNLFINFDPANLILYGTDHPIDALFKVGHLVRSVHCKDATYAPVDGRGTDWGAEVPLGEGDVGMLTYLRVLDSIGYTGPLTIEREIAEDRERQKADIGAAVGLLESIRDQIG